jgi:mannitol/fructose-specific phosphotransferase system IIA component (Ntr-type)
MPVVAGSYFGSSLNFSHIYIISPYGIAIPQTASNCWCQELVGTFLTSKKLFDFNSRK